MTKQARHVTAWSKRLLVTAATAMALGPLAYGQTPAKSAPAVTPAIDGILAAFNGHPLVGLGDSATAQEMDFYAALVRDPRFAREVGNVVVEFGGAAHQDTINRYVAGETVPYAELRKVWTDVVGLLPTITQLGYMNFYAQVRAVNASLPPGQRIHIWLGEPVIDWSNVKTIADLRAVLPFRAIHAADVIDQDILAKSRKALVIYRSDFFGNEAAMPAARSQPGTVDALSSLLSGIANGTPDYGAMTPRMVTEVREGLASFRATLSALGPMKFLTLASTDTAAGDTYIVDFANGPHRFTISLDGAKKLTGFSYEPLSIRELVERRHPGAFFVVTPYTGYAEAACSGAFEAPAAGWPSPSLVSVPGTTLATDLRRPGCHVEASENYQFMSMLTAAQATEQIERNETAISGAASDAVLYLGPASSLTLSPDSPDLYLDPAYRAEISQRTERLWGQPLPEAPDMARHTIAPQKLRP